MTDFKNLIFMESSDVTLWCGKVTKFKWDDLIYIVWSVSTQSNKCYIGLSPKPYDTCKDGKKLHNSTDGVSLSIPNISMQDEGFYICDLSYEGVTYNSLNISVSVVHLSTHLESDNGKKIAVCKARHTMIEPTLHWEPPLSVLYSYFTVDYNNASSTIENRVYLDDHFNIIELVCVATYPSPMSGSVRLKKTLQLPSGERFCLRIKEDTPEKR
ncbi:uncharacterized protein isoform X3 [Danio rerio]|uniref:Uncharacterized protein isoform X3 n=1 Tax=Danio rerio TaxID=7955 RepID=A0AC58GFT5_DANRE